MNLNPRVHRSILQGNSAFQPTSGTTYWTYIGPLPKTVNIKHVEMSVRTAGSGSQAAEVAIARSVEPPNKASQRLKIICVSDVLDSLLSTGIKRNTTAFNRQVRGGGGGLPLWLGIRTAMATTQPQFMGLINDFTQGYVLQTVASGALTANSVFVGDPLATAAAFGVDLRLTED